MGEFITPPSLPPDIYCRRLSIPNTPEWIGTVTGALMNLIYQTSWKQVDGITVEEATNRARLMFNQYLDSGNEGECDDMNCCPPEVAIRRFNEETGRPEVSYDGGLTWSEAPDDPENLVTLYPPLVRDGSDKTKCDAATNASQHINELITATGENLDTAATIFDLAVAVAAAVLGLVLIYFSAGALTAPITAVVTAIWAAAAGAFELGIDLYNAYWTTDKQDAILCALFCNIGENGQFTEEQYQEFRSKIKEQLPASPAFDIVMTAINAVGATGLSQMASYGNAALADCDDCSCELCDMDNWTLQYGTVVARDSTHIKASSTVEPADGKHYVIIYAPNAADCCVLGVDIDLGTQSENQIRPCGFDPAGTAGDIGGHNVNVITTPTPPAVGFKTRKDTAFTIDIFLA